MYSFVLLHRRQIVLLARCDIHSSACRYPSLAGALAAVAQAAFRACLAACTARSYASLGRIEGHIGSHHQPDLLTHMVKRQHFVEKQQAGIRNPQFVLCRSGSRSICRTASYAKNPTAPAVNGGIPGSRAGLCPPSASRSTLKMSPSMRVVRLPSVIAICTPARHDPLVGIQPDKRVSAHLLAAFHRLEQKTLALGPRRPQKRRHRCLEIGGQRAIYGHECVLLCKRQKLFTAGLDKVRGGFHRHQCNCSQAHNKKRRTPVRSDAQGQSGSNAPQTSSESCRRAPPART